MPFALWPILPLVLLCIAFPAFARWGERGGKFPSWLSSIIACYGIGILVANLRIFAIDEGVRETLEGVAGGAMLLGLPLLLFAVRWRESWNYAGSMLLSFALCVLSGLVCTLLTGLFFAGGLEDAWKVAGMLVGLYSGGTPNTQAIGLALDAPADYLILVQASDVLLGGAYLLGLVSFLPAIYARFFPPTPGGEATAGRDITVKSTRREQVPQFAIALAVLALSVGITRLISGKWVEPTIIILVLTTLSLVVGARPRVRGLGNTYPLGEYFILIFCVALGLMADFRELASKGGEILRFSAIALYSTTLLHLLLSRLFRIDRDTVILSSVAGFYGPVFVVQVATALKNQRLLAAGIAVSLLGFGVGNYLGIGLAHLLHWLAG